MLGLVFGEEAIDHPLNGEIKPWLLNLGEPISRSFQHQSPHLGLGESLVPLLRHLGELLLMALTNLKDTQGGVMRALFPFLRDEFQSFNLNECFLELLFGLLSGCTVSSDRAIRFVESPKGLLGVMSPVVDRLRHARSRRFELLALGLGGVFDDLTDERQHRARIDLV